MRWKRRQPKHARPVSIAPPPGTGMTGLCSIEGCGRGAVSRGWCSMHYSRWRVHGDPLATVPRGRKVDDRPPKGTTFSATLTRPQADAWVALCTERGWDSPSAIRHLMATGVLPHRADVIATRREEPPPRLDFVPDPAPLGYAPEHPCVICGEPTPRERGLRPPRRYCSQECRRQAQNAREKAKRDQARSA